MVLEDEGLEDRFGGSLFALGEPAHGREVEPEVLIALEPKLFVGAGLVLPEHEPVGRDLRRPGGVARPTIR